MAENENTPTPADAEPTSTTAAPVPPEEPAAAAAPASPAAPEAPVAQRPRLRDTVYTFRAMAAVAAATLLIGGAGGAALVALTHDDDRGPRVVRFDGPGRDRGFGGPHFGNGGGPGIQRFDGNRPGSPQDGGQNDDSQGGDDDAPAPGSSS